MQRYRALRRGTSTMVIKLGHPSSAASYEIAVPATEPLVVEVIERQGDGERRRTQTIPPDGVAAFGGAVDPRR
ncbi:MAG TPA: hypothetical protein VFY53_14210 [Rhodoplanes sp.]|nr:hypothetical protein [Rhodoplanes sp.]